jgi:hypothetical protein
MTSLVDIKPDLMHAGVRNEYNQIIDNSTKHNVVTDNLSSCIYKIYSSIIKDHLVLLLVVIAICVALYYRYKQTKGKREKFKIAKMNPTIPVRKQKNYNVYPPRPIPLNLYGRGPEITGYQRGLGNYKDIGAEYGAPYENPVNRSYYSIPPNGYRNAQSNMIPNPYFPYDFNTTTGDFVGNASERNERNLQDYKRLIKDRNQQLVDIINIGPNNVDFSGEVIAPY